MCATADSRDSSHFLTLEEIGEIGRETGNPAETLSKVVALKIGGSNPLTHPITPARR